MVAWVLLLVVFGGPGMAAAQPVTMKIAGTGGAYGAVKALAQAFEQQNPNIRIIFPPTLGSTGGIKAVLAGAIDLAISGRALSPAEIQGGAVAHVYGRTPLVFATPDQHEAATAHFTLHDFALIYEGKITTWPDGTPLRLVARPRVEYDNILLKAMSPEMAQAVSQIENRQGMRVAVNDNDNANMLVDLQGGLGAISLAQIMAEKLPLYPLSIGGVAPTLENLANSTYPYGKSFFLVTGPRTTAQVQKFLQFVFSPEGRKILVQTGHLPEPHAHE